MERYVSAVHEAQGGRRSPQALLACEMVVASGHLDPTGFQIDSVRTDVGGPEFEALIQLVQRAPHFPAGPGQGPVRAGWDRGSLRRLRRHDDVVGLYVAARPEESQGRSAPNPEPKAGRGTDAGVAVNQAPQPFRSPGRHHQSVRGGETTARS